MRIPTMLARSRWLELTLAVAAIAVAIVCLSRAWRAPLLLDPLLVAPPALAAIGASGIRRPLAFGAAAELAAVVVFLLTTPSVVGSFAPGTARDVPLATLVAVAVVTALSAVAARAAHASLTARLTAAIRASLDSSAQQHLANVASVAEVAQRTVLRPLPEVLENISFGVVYMAAAADAKVGGDLYEAVSTPHGVRVIVGDVRGKGLGAVEVAADVLGMYREVAYEVHTLGELARRLDAGLARRWGEHEEFVTALLAEVSPQTGRLTIFNCGHPPPMLLTAGNGQVRPLEVPAPAPPLGLMTLGDSSGAGLAVSLRPGDQVLLYTDGVTEARDDDRAFYPLEYRLPALAAKAASNASKAATARAAARGDRPAGPPVRQSDLLELVRQDLLKHVGAPLEDDAALLLVTAPGSWPAPARRHARALAR
ncbi:MAG TPA: PP2C family protein-serine/threonine phosphatase [Trebonia sp.]|jgi:serine phosphatase RsbU (regulator of sigma subunit)|nr:PP2C family protein-serine/threonine phosphatase [Trebonia sp.]